MFIYRVPVPTYLVFFKLYRWVPFKKAVLWIRIRMDPELLPGSGIKVPDPDPAESERADK